MDFLIADTFTDSLARLAAQEQKAAKTTAFDLQIDASAPGLSFHKLDRAKDTNLWSVRVNTDIRLIVHRTASSLLLAYVDHHDPAYKWAERRKIERHPTTGAMQLVEVRERVEDDFAGPARVSGSAGTGKTIVALHRAAHLARANPDAKVLLTTFSNALANALKGKLAHLVGHEPEVAARIVVKSITGVGYDLHARDFGPPNIAPASLVRTLLSQAAVAAQGAKFPPKFLLSEWSDVVDAWQLTNWDAYANVPRLGRKTRLGGKQREQLWAIFERVHAGLAERKAVTWAGVFGRVTERLTQGGEPPFDFAVIDEAQDFLDIAEARFFAALGATRPNALFFAGDLGQRIFQQPFSWKALGLDVKGRSFTLRINYRTSHQIRTHADGLLPGAIVDVDGASESRKGTVSVFSGPPPSVQTFADAEAETKAVGSWIASRLQEGFRAEEIGVFVRSDAQLQRARATVKAAGVAAIELSDKIEAPNGQVAISTMHLAKGLEFRAVAVMACDDEVLPLQERIETASDESDLEEVYNTERHLLYVACTRARDQLLVTGMAPGSEFLADFQRGK